MWTISDVIWLFLLLFLAGLDIKKRQVPGELLGVAGAGSVICHMVTGEQDMLLVLGGAAVGCLFMFISRITNEGLGYGDSCGIMMLGLYLGIWRILTVLSIAFFLLSCISIPFLWKRKMKRNAVLPFYPFLTVGYALLIFMGG